MADLDTVVRLDDFEFSELEIPEAITWGGQQQLVVHQLPGGERVVDSLGRLDRELSWSGLFFGENALDRARYVDLLRAQGGPRSLTWGQFRYTVVISAFEPSYERSYKIHYSISLLVISDDSQPIASFPQNNIDSAITSDMAEAAAIAVEVNDPPLSGFIAAVDTAISAVTTFANATTETIDSVLTPIKAAQDRVQILIAAASNTLLNVVTVGGAFQNPVAAIIARASARASAGIQQPQLVLLSSALGRMSSNLSLINGPANARSIAVSATSLYRVAADQYGDATAWSAIAKANNIVDPEIPGVSVLTIPNSPNLTGGVIQA